jgi:hypothetical protein
MPAQPNAQSKHPSPCASTAIHMQLVPPRVLLHRQNGQETALQHCPMGWDNHHPGRHHSPPTCRMSLCRPCFRCLPPPRPSLRQPRLCFYLDGWSCPARQPNEQRAARTTRLTACRWRPGQAIVKTRPQENAQRPNTGVIIPDRCRPAPSHLCSSGKSPSRPSPSYLIWRSSCAPSRWRRPWRQEASELG